MDTLARIDRAIREETRSDPTAEVDLDVSGGYNGAVGYEVTHHTYRVRRGLTFAPVIKIRVTVKPGLYFFRLGDGYTVDDGLRGPHDGSGWYADELDTPVGIIRSAIKEALK